jgi:hypothetical protein
LIDKKSLSFTVDDLYAIVKIENLSLVFVENELVLTLDINNEFLSGPWIQKKINGKTF